MIIIKVDLEVMFDDDVTDDEINTAMSKLADVASYCHEKAQDAEVRSWNA